LFCQRASLPIVWDAVNEGIFCYGAGRFGQEKQHGQIVAIPHTSENAEQISSVGVQVKTCAKPVLP
jgi:hypothetical protein